VRFLLLEAIPAIRFIFISAAAEKKDAASIWAKKSPLLNKP